jgi:hypothetical protein
MIDYVINESYLGFTSFTWHAYNVRRVGVYKHTYL